MRIAFTTLGCKANWVDTESLIQACARAGFEIVPFDSKADIYVVNTCTVTSIADQQSRQMLRRAKRANPEAIVIATGCVGETQPDELKGIEEVDRVFGTSDRAELLRSICGREESFSPPVNRQSRARAFLKIQDGCNKRCAYCIIPRARGKSRSIPQGDVVEACLSLSAHHHEIVLTGIDIGQYGWDLEKASLNGLLEELVQHDDMARFRISTLDPKQIDAGFTDLMSGSDKICRHVHLSIQSCSDSVLRSMCRSYRSDDVRRAVEVLSKRVSDIAITGDVIAGFPGETDDDHRVTADLLSSLPMAGLHVFPFSIRSGTKAESMPGKVPHDVIQTRAAELRGIANELRRKFLGGLLNKELDVIVTSRKSSASGSVDAFSDNGVSVSLPHGLFEYGALGSAKITKVENLEVFGSWR